MIHTRVGYGLTIALGAGLTLPVAAQGPKSEALPPDVIRILAAPAFRPVGQVSQLLVADAGKHLITCGGDGAILWDVATGKRLKTLVADPVNRLSMVGGMRAMHTGTNSIVVQESTTAKELLSVVHSSGVYALSSSRDHALLACRTTDDTIRLWNVTTGQVRGTLAGHDAKLMDLVFSPSGKLISIGADGTLREWDVTTREETRRLTEEADWRETALVLSADGKTLAVLSCCDMTGAPARARVRLLDSITLKERFRADVRGSGSRGLGLSADGRYVAAALGPMTGQDGQVMVWDSAGKQYALGAAGSAPVDGLHFVDDHKMLAVLAAGTVRLWNVEDGTESPLTQGPRVPAKHLAFARSGDLLASAHDRGEVHLWDAIKGTPLGKFPRFDCTVNQLQFSPDGTLLLVVGVRSQTEYVASLWKVPSGECIRTWQPVRGLAAFAPDGKTLAAADGNQNVRLWDVASGAELGQIGWHSHQVCAVAFSPDGRLLAASTAGVDGTTKLWQLAIKKPRITLPVAGALRFSHDGALLGILHEAQSGVAVDVYETISGLPILGRETDMKDGRGLWLLKDSTVPIWAVGRGTFHAFDMMEDQPLRVELDQLNDWTATDFTPDGKMVAVAQADGWLLLLKAPPLPARPRLANRLQESQFQELWRALAGSDAKKAFLARHHLSAAQEQTMALLRAELRPVPKGDAKQVAEWIRMLDSDSFKERERATLALGSVGEAAEAGLLAALEQQPSLEMRLRAEALLAKISSPKGRILRELRAIHILEAIGSDEAKALLRELADGAPAARLTEAARAALLRWPSSAGWD
jgi:WD40 repeat protein